MPMLGELGLTNIRSFWPQNVSQKTRDLADLSHGLVADEQPRTCPGPTNDARVCPQGWSPAAPQLRQCAEAMLDRGTGEWVCAATGDRCGSAGQPSCVAPAKLWAWVDDFNMGVVKMPVTPQGDVIYPEGAAPGISAAAPSGVGLALVLGGAGLLFMLLRR